MHVTDQGKHVKLYANNQLESEAALLQQNHADREQMRIEKSTFQVVPGSELAEEYPDKVSSERVSKNVDKQHSLENSSWSVGARVGGLQAPS